MACSREGVRLGGLRDLIGRRPAVRRRRIERGGSLLETVVALALTMAALQLAFEGLGHYLTVHRRSLLESAAVVGGLGFRDVLIARLSDGMRGLGLRGSGGATPLGRTDGRTVGAAWLAEDGSRLRYVERAGRASPGTVLYARRAGDRMQLIVAPGAGWGDVAPPFAAVLGLPAPEDWPSALDPAPGVGAPFDGSPRYGYMAQVTAYRAAAAADVPDTEPEAERIRKALSFGTARWMELALVEVGGLAPPREASAILSSPHVAREWTSLVTPVAGVAEVVCTADGGVRLTTAAGEVEELLPAGSLEVGGGFRYVRSDLSETTSFPRLREHFGLSFSGRLRSSDGRGSTAFYAPLSPIEWRSL